jgi:hypothetical protein
LPDEIYEIIALAARYWFLLLMVLIAWRSYRWLVRDRKTYKKRLRLLPDAGYVGELVVMQGNETVQKGTCLPVGREGVLGYLRSNDVCLPVGGVANRHLWFSFDDTDGLMVEPLRGRMIVADGEELVGRRMRACLAHGSQLQVGEAKLRLRMFAGFEYAGEISADRQSLNEDGATELPCEPEDAQMADSVRRMHEIAAWQTMAEEDEAAQAEPEFYPPETDEPEYYPPEPGEPDNGDEFLPPMDGAAGNSYELQDGTSVFYPPVADGEDDLPDGKNAPKSLYVDESEAATANRMVWDRMFRGGKKR